MSKSRSRSVCWSSGSARLLRRQDAIAGEEIEETEDTQMMVRGESGHGPLASCCEMERAGCIIDGHGVLAACRPWRSGPALSKAATS